MQQLPRAKAEIKKIIKKSLDKYQIDKEGSSFIIDGEKYSFPYLLPEEIFYSIAMCHAAVDHLHLTFDDSFKHFIMAPGRGSIFEGIKNTMLIDSSYNAN